MHQYHFFFYKRCGVQVLNDDDRPSWLEFQTRLLALTSKTTSTLLPTPASRSSSLARPTAPLMARSRSSSSHSTMSLIQSTCRLRTVPAAAASYSRCEFRPSAVVMPRTLWSHDTQYRFPLLWSTWIRQTGRIGGGGLGGEGAENLQGRPTALDYCAA